MVQTFRGITLNNDVRGYHLDDGRTIYIGKHVYFVELNGQELNLLPDEEFKKLINNDTFKYVGRFSATPLEQARWDQLYYNSIDELGDPEGFRLESL